MSDEIRESIRTLKRARYYITHGWTQGAPAREAPFGTQRRGYACSARSANAQQWCLQGALAVQPYQSQRPIRALLAAIRQIDPDCDSIPRFNDAAHRTVEHVLTTLNVAIHLETMALEALGATARAVGNGLRLSTASSYARRTIDVEAFHLADGIVP